MRCGVTLVSRFGGVVSGRKLACRLLMDVDNGDLANCGGASTCKVDDLARN